MPVGWAPAALALVLGSAAPAGAEPFERVVDSGFPTDFAPWFRSPVDVVAADMDLDGDPDLLVNWHHYEPLELYENDGGRFVLRNAEGNDTSGVYDNPGVPQLFAEAQVMAERIAADGRAGLFLWHDADRAASWRLVWVNPAGRLPGLRVRVETSLSIEEVTGLEESELERPAPRVLHITLPRHVARRSVSVRVGAVATGLRLEPEAVDGDLPPVFAGATLSRLRDATIDLWKPDPHGIAWVDVQGSPHPELFITRGGLGGKLVPPKPPKTDRYYVASGSPPPLHRFAPRGTVPPSRTRGRRVEWVDVQGDGTLALSVANHGSPNALLVPGPDGAFQDVAAALGLDLLGASVQAWSDIDGDGRQDLFFLAGRRIDVLRNRGDGFARVKGTTLGLRLPPALDYPGIIEHSALRFSDFDDDGDLDLWLLGHGKKLRTRLFRRERRRFADVTEEVGLGDARGFPVTVLLDVDNDGFEDAVGFGKKAALWRNRGGRSFERSALPASEVVAATACDVDGDGRTDLVAMGKQRLLLRNAASNGNRRLEVSLRDGAREPIGALVKAYYASGAVRAQRYGSAASSALSQALLPLHFGVREGGRIEKIGVRWPGQRQERDYPVAPEATRLVVER